MNSILATIAVLSALAYGAIWCNKAPSLPRTVSKTMPVGMLALLAWQNGFPNTLVLALSLSALGDLLLSRESDGYFLGGMTAFLGAHLAYMGLFWGSRSIDLTLGDRLIYFVILACYAVIVILFLWSQLGKFRLPVSLYVLVIAGMGASALSLPWHTPTSYVVAGVLLFLFSDTLLATQKFRPAFFPALNRPAPFLVWASYIAAQGLIATGFAPG